MKKISLFGAAALCAALMMTGCQSVNNSGVGSMTINPETVGPVTNFRPIYKLMGKEPVTGTAKVHSLFGLFVWSDSGGMADYASTVAEDDSAARSFLSDRVKEQGGFGSDFELFTSTKSEAAKAAFYDACVSNNCDAIVAAKYTIKNTSYVVYDEYEITVTGWPVKLVGVEPVEPVPYYINGRGKLEMLPRFMNMQRVFETTDEAGAKITEPFTVTE